MERGKVTRPAEGYESYLVPRDVVVRPLVQTKLGIPGRGGVNGDVRI